MQYKNQNGGVQLSSRYLQYCFAKRHLGGEPRRKVFPLEGTDGEANEYAKIIELNKPRHSNNRVFSVKGISPTIDTMQGGNRQPFIKVDTSTETGYNDSDANAKKTRPDKTLSTLPKADNKTEIQQREIDEPSSFQKDEVLQQRLYEEGVYREVEGGCTSTTGECESKDGFRESESVRGVRKGRENGDTPQRRGQAEQQAKQSSGTVQGMPHKEAPDRGEKEGLLKEAERQKWKIRRLTPLETLRLQGFPDDWYPENMSNSQKYKQAGNAVTVSVIEAIFKKLL